MKIQTAARIDRLPPYILGQLKTLIYERRKAGADIIDMNMGNPSDAPPDPVVDKIREAVLDPRNSRYSASAGIYNLRRDMAIKYEKKWGVELDPATEVIATIGSKEGFSHMCLALLGAGDIAVVADPAFQIHTYAVVLAGGSTVTVPLGNDDAFLERIDQVLDTLTPQPKVVILNYPHNPTTLTVEPSFFEKVVELAERHQVMILHDFAYGETAFDGYRPPSFLQARGAKAYGVEFSTLSKPYNMAGWRIGFCCGHPEMIRALSTIKGYYDYGIFQAVQIAAIIAMREGEGHIERQNEVYGKRREVLASGLRKFGWEVELPRATMFVWAKVNPEQLAAYGGSTNAFCLAMVDKAEVALTPGAAFGPRGEGYVRMALVENEQRIRQALRQMGRVLAPAVV
ncbi:aminotransferase class I/II-fold pyridoxal phosphate-dependent enzyme [Mucisphaera calidilacus]|uniref:Glutamate-pyruvate aminotransferase AlaC n=1 Tax=Mucisphaera calidilacus TaxID=2527982 RepID=A0A518BXI2_9BACT|nr:aminotransferase class I/II-fold pyridoxal phosphate-dependent enzyme [Mucisphaera calidilacus]QDU71687.1 Glutamate-pyruvate aminotransferase AlaC [Mucisphaera calidilacus]